MAQQTPPGLARAAVRISAAKGKAARDEGRTPLRVRHGDSQIADTCFERVKALGKKSEAALLALCLAAAVSARR